MSARAPFSLTVSGATVRYSHTTLFQNLNFTLRSHRWTCLLGASGVGKTALLKFLVQNQSMDHRVAYMSQEDQLLPWYKVIDNLLLGYTLRGDSSKKLEWVSHAEHMLERVGLADVRHYYPHQLSKGMRQRVALIRTFLENRPIVLLDEPFSALDVLNKWKCHEIATDLLKEHIVLFVTHDPFEALRLGHSVWVMRGRPADLLPTLDLKGPIPRVPTEKDAALHERLLRTLEGSDQVLSSLKEAM